jgi:hypothetical protein
MIMKRLLLAAGMMSALAVPVAAQDIGGDYDVLGTNLDGSSYQGTAQIVVTSETTCEIYWTTGGTTSSGICMRNGNAFSAGYVLGDAIGLVIYEILDDGSMEGLWTVAGKDGSGTEKLTPQ